MTDEFKIERAVRQQALLRLAISGVSGSGKTKGSLRVASGIVAYMLDQKMIGGTLEGKVGVVDTERNSASLYARMYPFDRISLVAPYTVQRYLGAARALANAGKTVVIIDQISHQWAGQGGMLELVDLIRAKVKNDFAAWKDASPEQNEFLEGLLALPCHLICTMRAKTAYVLEEKQRRDGTTYQAPKRIGLKPIQREGVEYEFTTVMDLDLDTKAATVSKDRTELFVDAATLKSKQFVLTEEVGRQMAEWLYKGEAVEATPIAPPLERARATAESGTRQMGEALNIPDLQRIWTQLYKDLREFDGALDRDTLHALVLEATAAKDRRKALLQPSAPTPPAGGFIEPAVAVELERLLKASGADEQTAQDALGVARLGLLPAAKLQAAFDWIAEEHLANTGEAVVLSKPLLDAGVKLKAVAPAGHFDDLKDDVPWK